MTAIEIIIEERKNNGPFTSIFDFASRVDLRKVNRKAFESLIRAGAFDQIHSNRASLLASVNLAITKAEQGHAHQGQNKLFEEFETSDIPLVDADIWEERKQLAEEKIALGFYFSNHPFKFYKKMIREFVPSRLSELKPRESSYLIAGIISVIRMRMTSRGKIAIITLDDGEGRIDVVIGNKILVEVYDLIKEDNLLIVEGRVSHDDFTGGNRVSAIKVNNLLTIQSSKAAYLFISIKESTDGEKLKELLKPYCNGAFGNNLTKCKVKVEYSNHTGKVELLLGPDWEVTLHEDLILKLSKTFHDDNVKIIYN